MQHPTSQPEREIEFAAPADLEVPDLRGVVGRTERLPEQLLTDTYFDTDDLRLWSRGVTLRHRVEATPPGATESGVWTLCLPSTGAGNAAEGQELRWIGDGTEIPSDAQAVLRGLVRRETLEKVTELVTLRLRLLLRNRQGEIWAEVDDDTVKVHSGPQDGLTFRRLRVDLVGEPAEKLDPVLAELRHAGARREDEETLGKVLGADEPGKADRGRRDKTASIGDVVAATIGSDLERLLDHDVGLRLYPHHPLGRDVHQARVATRRLRADLKTLSPLLDPVWVRHTRAELKTTGEALGSIRDADVLTSRLGVTDGAAQADKGMVALAKQLVDERDQATATLAELLGSEDYLNLLDRLHAASVHPPLLPAPDGRGDGSGTPASKALPPLVYEQWKTLRRRVRKAGKHPSDARLHRIRIGAKQLRYAAELSEPVVGKPARRTAAAAEGLQDLLGDHHDMVTAQAWLRATGRAVNAEPAAAFASGLLAAEQQRCAADLRHEWRAAWGKVKKKKRRRWMVT